MFTEELTENSYLVTHEVGADRARTRLDQFLKEKYRKRSREAIKRAIENGVVHIVRPAQGHLTLGRLKPSSILFPGDEVMVRSEKKNEPEVDFNYSIIYEDDDLFVIHKPANLPVHPAGRYFFNTLLIHLRTQGHRKPLPAGKDYYLAHRIDKETSGILVLAKSSAICADLVEQFASRTTEKSYLAIVRGKTEPEFEVDQPMMRVTKGLVTLKMVPATLEQGGLPALTRFKTLSYHHSRLAPGKDFSLVQCFPKTGRQHQIRVHLDFAGHPIVGDKLYGITEEEAFQFYERKLLSAELQARLLLPRHALHSNGLRFTHPVTRKRMEFTCPLPPDLQEFLAISGDSFLKLDTPRKID